MGLRRLFILSLSALMCTVSAEAGIRVMSFNVRQGMAADGDNAWDNRKEASAAMLEDLRPDVFGVQEAYAFQVDYILANCPVYKAVGVGRNDGSSEGEHMSVFYNAEKLELIDWGTYWLSETPEVPSKSWDAKYNRTATWTLLRDKSTGRRLFFVNTHLDHKGVVARKESLALIHRRITAMNPDGAPMILVGDFNLFPDDEGLTDLNKLMKSARCTAIDADTMGSFNGWGKSETIIDYIYYSGFRVCRQFRVISRKYADKPYISDHYPIMADLED